MILKDQDVPETDILFQVQHSVAISPEDVFDLLPRQIGQAVLVVRRFDDDFVGADAVHAVVEAKTFTPQVAFHLKSGKFVGDHADGPIGRIRLRCLRPVGHDFFGGQPFLSRAKGADPGRNRLGRWRLCKIVRATAPVRRDNDPATDNGITT